MNILAVGDVTGKSGMAVLSRHLRPIKKLKSVDFTVVNGENCSGLGISPAEADELFNTGADVITLGNHVWGRREIADYLEDSPYILRPYNLPARLPGRGYGIYEVKGRRVCVASLLGIAFSENYGAENPFFAVEKLFNEIRDKVDITLIDFHAEATSEKNAFLWYVAGRVSAVFGTHTHVQTADERVLKGTGFITDLGMTGPVDSVLGIKPESSIALFTGEIPRRFESADGEGMLCGAIFEVEDTGSACKCVERIAVR